MGNPFSTIVTARDSHPKMAASASLATTDANNANDAIENTTATTVFEPKIQSPIAHLKILRNPKLFNQKNSSYFSPALGNSSEAWIRSRANTYRTLRLNSDRKETETKRKSEQHTILDADYDKAMAQVKAWKSEAAQMRANNDQWVISVTDTTKALEQQQDELKGMFDDTKKVNITNILEGMMKEDGRSLGELKDLEKAVIETSHVSKYWPIDYDSEADSDEEDEDDEHHHLYSFPLPVFSSDTTSRSDSEEEQIHSEDDANDDETTDDEQIDDQDEQTYEDSTATTLLPDIFDWADESEDMEELTPAPFEDRFDNFINNIHHRLNAFRRGLTKMKEELHDQNRFTLL